MKKRWYSVAIEAESPHPNTLAAGLIESMLDILLKERSVTGPVVTSGPGAQVSVKAKDPIEALEAAGRAFHRALEEVGIGRLPVAHAEVMTEEYQEQWLSEPGPEYIGLAEIAEILGVSKQRVFQLRWREDFPRPIAELAAGPVWNRVSLNHFIANWERRPGRPARRDGSSTVVAMRPVRKAGGGSIRRTPRTAAYRKPARRAARSRKKV